MSKYENENKYKIFTIELRFPIAMAGDPGQMAHAKDAMIAAGTKLAAETGGSVIVYSDDFFKGRTDLTS